ncbi:MAG: ABC transporter permease [Pyrinomonadaceae bacterium]
MRDLLKDVRYSLRLFRRYPLFSGIIILSLSLGIGASTAVFSLLNAVLLRELPYATPERLVAVWEDNTHFGFPKNLTSPANYRDWAAQNKSFEQLAAVRETSLNLTGDGQPEEAQVVRATPNLFTVLGVQPLLGRDLSEEDDRTGAKVALLSHGLWTRRFGSDQGVLNKTLYLNGESYSVVGVMPRGIDFPAQGTQIWIPASFTQADWARRTSHFLQVVGRLKPGVSLAQAQTEMKSVAENLKQAYPDANANSGIVLVGLKEELVGDKRPVLLSMMAAICFVLLIACSNTANLMLVRTARRRREIALRLALGASRMRLVRQMLTESLLLAIISGLVGLLIAPLSFSLLSIFVPSGIAASTELKLDPRALVFTLAVSVLTALLFGTIPSLQSAGVNLLDTLKRGGSHSAVGGRSRLLQKALVIAEISMAFLLLVGAALMVQTYIRLRQVELGFKPEGVLTLRTPIAGAKYEQTGQRLAFFQEVLNRVRALPGVESAGYISYLPLTTKGTSKGFLVEGQPPPPPGQMPLALFRIVSPGYFETLEIPLVKGRRIEQTDGPTSQVAVINEAMAKKFWPNEDPVGRRFTLPGVNQQQQMLITVVGVVGDVKETGADAESRPAMYLSYLQFTQANLVPADLAVRTRLDPSSLTTSVRQQIWAVDPAQPIVAIRPMKEIVDSEVRDRKVNMWLLTIFAGVAILQAILGIYGVLANTVVQQTREIGLRMALGATPARVLRLVWGQGMLLVGVGILLGLGVSIALTRFISSLLYGVGASDPMTFLAVAVGLIIIAAIAIYIPARQAMKIDPMRALRME